MSSNENVPIANQDVNKTETASVSDTDENDKFEIKTTCKIGIHPELDKYYRFKYERLMSTVFRQEGFKGRMVIIQIENVTPFSTLHDAVNNAGTFTKIVVDYQTGEHVLLIDKKEYGRGMFPNMKASKSPLAETALAELKQYCFCINKKITYTGVTNDDLGDNNTDHDDDNTVCKKSKPSPSVNKSIMMGSVAHKMMLKMGWAGEGLGACEQGDLEPVTVYENVSRQGLGSMNIMPKVTDILRKFSETFTLSTLLFDTEFTKDEREAIHKVARQCGLKSKSVGTQPRKLTVTQKHTRYDLVRELLKTGGEDESFVLEIPSKFAHIL